VVHIRLDADLVRRVHGVGGDAGAGELFRRHYPALLRYAKTLTNDSSMAEDLASEALRGGTGACQAARR